MFTASATTKLWVVSHWKWIAGGYGSNLGVEMLGIFYRQSLQVRKSALSLARQQFCTVNERSRILGEVLLNPGTSIYFWDSLFFF